jgi:DNA-binding NarL/FixJ family response regulator
VDSKNGLAPCLSQVLVTSDNEKYLDNAVMTGFKTAPVTVTAAATALPASIQVAVVEDDIDFQRAVAEAVASAPEMTLVGVAGTCAQGLALVQRVQVDVLLVDLGLPDGSGLQVMRAALRLWPDCNVMVCTMFGDEQHVMQSIAAGARGYLLKDTGPRRIVAEIRSLVAGGSPISPMIARQMLLRFRAETQAADASSSPEASTEGAPTSADLTRDAPAPRLSPREHEVLNLITRGYTAEEIASLLKLTRHTVLTFVRRAYTKLNVSSKAEAIYELQNRP